MKFLLYKNKYLKLERLKPSSAKTHFDTLEDLFEFLYTKEKHKTQTAQLKNAQTDFSLEDIQDETSLAIFYTSYEQRWEDSKIPNPKENQSYYSVMQFDKANNEKNITFEDFCATHAAWAAAKASTLENATNRKPLDTPSVDQNKRKVFTLDDADPDLLDTTLTDLNEPGFLSKVFNPGSLYKAFHPGNTLFISVVLTAVGIGLIGFGIACPPALVFAALGIAAFSAISAIGYTIDWLKRDWDAYKKESTTQTFTIEHGVKKYLPPTSHSSLFGYIEHHWINLQIWLSKQHPIQVGFMIVGAVLFLGALIITSCALAGVPLFAFMTAGAFGGAIGLVSSFFSAGLSSISVSASVAALLASIFTGAALIAGPTNILDTIRRAFIGFFWGNEESEYFLVEDLTPESDSKNEDEPTFVWKVQSIAQNFSENIISASTKAGEFFSCTNSNLVIVHSDDEDINQKYYVSDTENNL